MTDRTPHESYVFIHRTMVDIYALGELRVLCGYLGVAADHLRHDTLPELAVALLGWADRRGPAKRAELLGYLREKRRDVAWPDDYASAVTIFDKRDAMKEVLAWGEVLLRLAEWKLLHHASQNLLLSVYSWETARIVRTKKRLKQFRKDNDDSPLSLEQSIAKLDLYWRQHCQSRAERLVELLTSVEFIKRPELEWLNMALADTQASIYRLRVDQLDTLDVFFISFEQLKDSLTEVLQLTDFQIVSYVEELQRKGDIGL